MLKNDFEFREVAPQWDQLRVNEHGFAVKQVNVRRCHFTMNQQQHTRALHRFQRFVGFAQIGHAGIAVGGCASGVELSGNHTSVFGAFDFIGRQVVGQIQGHQRLKRHACGHGGLNTRFVSQCLCGCGHRRAQIRHDDGTTELGGGVRNHRVERIAVAHMQMPIVRASDRQGFGRCCLV